MIRFIGISQRIEEYEHLNEFRDCLDQRWIDYILSLNLLPLLLPNNPCCVLQLLKQIKVSGFILSGGGVPNDCSLRAETEKTIINYACEAKLPVIGVCRGMQAIATHFGGNLQPVDHPIGVFHEITWENGSKQQVNSFHHLGLSSLPACFKSLATSQDYVIEAIKHKIYPLYGLMWHPERNFPFYVEDQRIIKRWLNA